jgi:hypothetical protein
LYLVLAAKREVRSRQQTHDKIYHPLDTTAKSQFSLVFFHVLKNTPNEFQILVRQPTPFPNLEKLRPLFPSLGKKPRKISNFGNGVRNKPRVAPTPATPAAGLRGVLGKGIPLRRCRIACGAKDKSRTS